MTLKVSPALKLHTDRTADSSGSTLRATIDCRATTTCAAASRVSTHLFGCAACRPLPSTVIVKRSAAAMIGPGRIAKWPDRMPGQVVHAVDLLHAEAFHEAVLHHASPPPPPSSAGWKIMTGRAVEVARLGEVLRGAEQHGRVPVMAAGMHEAGVLRLVGRIRRLRDRQRVHVRPQARRPCRPSPRRPRITPTTPVRPRPVTTSSQPNDLSLSATSAAVL
jgi:hypothetical protein